ncbi:hypothetical protein EW146_g8868 [Bondarzewia mesenterica]|uniref:HMG box domain-containing protein n=1 Tax=Bondarzewia mesenterica TaxID=1095465 RepID=A0A4S4LBA3_9AGAM|nr:hypothetical protein EW146_g8868 [Bondarzewia mesenterica]
MSVIPAFDLDDDDGMPPLVDRPPPLIDNPSPLIDGLPPPLMMTYTFNTDFTPITYSTDPTRFEIISEEDAPRILAPDRTDSDNDLAATGATGLRSTSHSKKHDASYIPRPPNAFILFRSSFIRSQQIPGKIEGNHSTLSKIIGPARALGGPGGQSAGRAPRAVPSLAFPPRRQRARQSQRRTHARRANGKKNNGGGGGGRKARNKVDAASRSRERRCAKIAGLLVGGMKGGDLEQAVLAWDEASGFEIANASQDGGDVLARKEVQVKPVDVDVIAPQAQDALKARSASPDRDARFRVPLTAMFKRSSSEPVACASPLLLPLLPPTSAIFQRRDSVCSLAPSSPYTMSMSPAPSLSLSLSSSDAYGTPMNWNDVSLKHPFVLLSILPSQRDQLISSRLVNSDFSYIQELLVSQHPHSPPASPIDVTCSPFLIATGDSTHYSASPPSYLSTYSSLQDWAGDVASMQSPIAAPLDFGYWGEKAVLEQPAMQLQQYGGYDGGAEAYAGVYGYEYGGCEGLGIEMGMGVGVGVAAGQQLHPYA